MMNEINGDGDDNITHRTVYRKHNAYNYDARTFHVVHVLQVQGITARINLTARKVKTLSQIYYAALLPRRGAHIASHSVRLSVRLSVRPVIVAIGNVFSSTASVTDVLFGTH